jgi:hypothetical protein
MRRAQYPRKPSNKILAPVTALETGAGCSYLGQDTLTQLSLRWAWEAAIFTTDLCDGRTSARGAGRFVCGLRGVGFRLCAPYWSRWTGGSHCDLSAMRRPG